MRADGLRKSLAGFLSYVDEAAVIVQRKFGVDGQQLIAEAHHRVHDVTGGEAMLYLVGGGR